MIPSSTDTNIEIVKPHALTEVQTPALPIVYVSSNSYLSFRLSTQKKVLVFDKRLELNGATYKLVFSLSL